MSVIEDILIKADSSYIEAQSKPENNHFVFSYTISIAFTPLVDKRF